MKYHHFTVEDFAADDYFQEWVLCPSPEHEAFWQDWLQAHPDQRQTVEQARWLIQRTSFAETWTATERQEIWRNVQAGLLPAAPARLWRMDRKVLWLAAACLALLLVAGGGYFLTRPGWQELRTSFGEIKRIRLDDGTYVTLNANSQLRFARKFLDQAQREIWIDGEAYFEVVPRVANGQKVPFFVHTPALSVRVLGTAFNVTNRRGKVDVALEHGSVEVFEPQNKQKVLRLAPGELVSRASHTAPLVKQEVSVDDYTSWRNHLILFKRKSLAEIADMMKDLYDIDVVIDNPALQAETFTGSFPADSAELFFEKLRKMYPIEIRREGTRYRLR